MLVSRCIIKRYDGVEILQSSEYYSFKTIDFFCGVGGLFLHANVKNLFGCVINLLHL